MRERAAPSSASDGNLHSQDCEETAAWNSELADPTNKSSSGQTSGMGLVPLQPGELEGMFERPTSAPPPPGFGAGPEERNRMATELLWGQSDPSPATGGEDIYNSLGLGNDFANVLGSGLMQSMEDATQERNNIDAMFHPKAAKKDDLNFTRQTRHAASRLIGADPVLPPANQAPAQTSSMFSADAPAFKMQYNRASTPTAAAAQQPQGRVQSRGFPSMLSSPSRRSAELEQKRDAQRGSTTPVQMFPGQSGDRRSLPITKDIGMNVMEPEGENQFTGKVVSGIRSQRLDSNQNNNNIGFGDHVSELERGVQNMWTPTSGPPPDRGDDGNSSISDSLGGATEVSSRQAEADLIPYLWDGDRTNRHSRTLAILHVSYLRIPDVRSACEAYGVVETFRSDFASKGIYFVSFYDIRSTQYAAMELQPMLQRMSLAQRSSEDVIVRYCLPLNSSSQFDESQILIHDLPPAYQEHNLSAILSSYGAVRSVVPQGAGTFIVEFQNVQDTKQALLELDSSQPWGDSVTVEVGMRNPVDRKKGRELLAILSRWRQAANQRLNTTTEAAAPYAGNPNLQNDRWRPPGMSNSSSTPGLAMSSLSSAVGMPPDAGNFHGYARQPRQQEATQVVLGPDGRYTQVVMQNSAPPAYNPYAPRGADAVDQRHQQQQQQQIIHGPNGQIYIATVPSAQQSSHVYMGQSTQNVAYPATILTSNSNYVDSSRRGGQGSNTPYYAHSVSNDGTSLSGRSHRSIHSQNNEDKDTRHLLLDLDAVETGIDSRTSLMVRNIPNKYTQRMLLSEFVENGHGPGVIDFFYLPIDFKNRCNRGYAFINFVDHKEILPFHRRYFGKHWRTFNSDKICDITYARIQGKAAMLKRFENSALMEKDDEYKPLVFVSDGPDKGNRLPFPNPATKTS